MPRTYSFTKMLRDGKPLLSHKHGGCAMTSLYMSSCRIFARRAAGRNVPVTCPVDFGHRSNDMKMRLKG